MNTVKATKYRPDIDGLRAVAISLVVIFHFFPEQLPAGFLGVDIFFVISGFLISDLIIQGLDKEKFSLKEFYVRRIARIFPALLLVLLFGMIYGYFFLYSNEYQQIGKHVFAGSFFVSNFVLLSEVGYFDNVATTKPLLHLWSLGIEEQFYIFWPICLLVIIRLNFHLIFSIAIIFASSLALYFSGELNSDYTFYLPITRIWQLLLGALLAATLFRHNGMEKWIEDRVWAKNTISVLGVVLILLPLSVGQEHETPDPFMVATITVGAFFIIFAGQSAIINKIVLSQKIMVWVGLISFPLYLWYWPLLTFSRIIEGKNVDLEHRVYLILLAIFLGWGTYKFIETPIRNGGRKHKKSAVLLFLMFITGIAGLFIEFNSGLSFREVNTARIKGELGHTAYYAHIKQNYFPCKNKEIYRNSTKTGGQLIRCFETKQDRPADVALIGDSHAEHLFIGLAEAIPQKNIIYALRSGFPYDRNEKFSEVLSMVKNSPSIKTVVLSMFWADPNKSIVTNENLFNGLKRLVSNLSSKGKKVFLFDDVPSFSFDPRLCKEKSDGHCSEKREFLKSRYATYIYKLREIERSDDKVSILYAYNTFCDELSCAMKSGGRLLYRDSNHLSIYGSQLMLQKSLSEEAIQTLSR